MTVEEKYAEAKALIQTGESVLGACRQMELLTNDYYKYREKDPTPIKKHKKTWTRTKPHQPRAIEIPLQAPERIEAPASMKAVFIHGSVEDVIETLKRLQ